MSLAPETADALIDALAPVVGITIEPDFRPGVRQFLILTAAMATRVLEFPVAEETEPAGVFRP